ncbi:type VI secretion system lipoprotein TssJ [Colwellia sp. MEBiC06753]
MIKRFFPVFVVALMTILASCSSTNEHNVDFSYFITASDSINPDIQGQPSPVLVRVYQLANNVNFENATYDSLFQSNQNTLGGEYISLNEYLIHPDSKNNVELQISENAKYIGVAVGYRSVEMVTWRTIVKVPEGKFWRDAGLEIKVDKLSVRVIEL